MQDFRFNLLITKTYGEKMKALIIALSIIVVALFTGCQAESFNPVDSLTETQTINKIEVVSSSARLFAFDNKEPKAWGHLDYQVNDKFEFNFRGHRLQRNTAYVLCYGNVEVASGISNNGGNLILNDWAEEITYETIFILWYADENGNQLSPVPSEAKVLIDGFKADNNVN